MTMDSLLSKTIPLITPILTWISTHPLSTLITLLLPLLFLHHLLLLQHKPTPLSAIPGPFFARHTNLYRLYLTLTHRFTPTIRALHKTHGPAVLIGPNTVSLDYPSLIKTIHSTSSPFRKTEFYASSSAVINGITHYTLFAEPDADVHARMKKPIAKYYTVGAVLGLEGQMDAAIAEFCKQVDGRFVVATGRGFDLLEWMLFLAWDVSACMIFSKEFGYLRRGEDFDGTIGLSKRVGRYFEVVGQMPVLDFWLDKNPVVRIGPGTFSGLVGVAVEGLGRRMRGEDGVEGGDYLQHFMDAKGEGGLDDGAVVAFTMLHVIAGADTTALTVVVVLWYVLTHPEAWERLVGEVRGAGWDVERPVPYAVARGLPYLEAVWLEATRLQPIAGMQYERYVPAEGLTLPNGVFIPPGTAVGLNPSILGRNTSVFGSDAEEFRPERWLRLPGEDDESYAARLRLQRTVVDLNFGAGSRICLGKNLGIVETYKILATLVNRYDIELEGDGGWEVKGTWMRRPSRLMVKFSANNM